MDKQVLEDIKRRIVGKKVSKVEGGMLTLDDGTSLILYESDQDCCAVAYGEWSLIGAENLEAGITDIEFEQIADREYNGDGHDSSAIITILHNQNALASADCFANDGNGGYYFSVLSLRVRLPGSSDYDAEVISA